MSDIKQTFSTPPPSAFASYNYTDIAEGTGTSLYYGILGPTTSTFNLIPILEDGILTESTYVPCPNGLTTLATIAPFNQPKTIKGTAFLICKCNFQSGSGGSNALKLYKVDGITAAETLICTMGTFTVANNSSFQIYTSGATTETHFKRGDSLRLKAQVTTSINNWTFNVSTTNPFKLGIPFKITEL